MYGPTASIARAILGSAARNASTAAPMLRVVSARAALESMGFRHGGEIGGEQVYMSCELGIFAAEHVAEMVERSHIRASIFPTAVKGRFVVVAYESEGSDP